MEIVTAAGGCRSPVLPEAAAFYVLINNVNIFIIFFWGKKKIPGFTGFLAYSSFLSPLLKNVPLSFLFSSLLKPHLPSANFQRLPLMALKWLQAVF